ncbi:MAG: tetratricopeptide repeat protein, partial [Chthoniobacterales bacterium]|nr:tetratricopeptide repeat protein [Chthoniobacterales bacterium]
SINELDTKIIPEGGTNISEAIALATRTFGKAATGNRALIIFTDGEELSGDAVKTAKGAAEAGVRIFTVGVGTPGGSLIPIQSENGGTAFVNDAKGEVVKSKLDEARLREVAQAAEGFYLHLGNGPRTMQQLVTDGLGKMKVADINARLSRKPIERYEWPLAAAIFLFALALLINDRQRKSGGTGAVPSPNQKQGRHSPRRAGFGRPSQAIAVAIFLLVVRQGFAASAGLELYEQQKFPEAYEHFQKTLEENPGARQSDRIQFDAGAAAYKMKDYNKALQSFSQALLSKNSHLQSESHYNLGNTLYQRGEAEKSDDKKLTNWEEALKHYEETLKAEPQNKKARDNYDYVKKKIEELKKKQEEKPSPTPTPSPSPSPQKDQKDDQRKDDKDQQKQDKNDQQKKDGQQQSEKSDGSGEGEKSEDGQQSPSPTPSPSPSPSPSESPSPSPGEDGAGQSPTPTPSPPEGDQPGASPSPSPGEEASPSPTPGEGEQNGGEYGEPSSPTPAPTPDKPLTGDVKGAGEEKPPDQQPPEVAEAEPEKEGEMSPKQAALLLQAMKDEEQKVQLDEHKPVRPVYNDW